MKKVILAVFAMFAAINLANAQFTGNPAGATAGGFAGPRDSSVANMTVKQALDMRDDSIVVLTGKIISSLGDEKYLFGDSTGQVIIEIDDEDWHGVTVTPENTIEIVGELDKELFDKTKIDVNSFKIIQ